METEFKKRSAAWFFRLVTLLLVVSSSSAAENWNGKPLPPLPDTLGVAAPFAGVSGGSLLVAGGANFPDRMPWDGGRKTWHDRIWLLDKPHGSWRPVGKLPLPRAYGISATTPNGVVCVGGSDAARHYPDVFQLAWRDDVLVTETLPSLPIALANAGGALVGKTLFVACGAEQPGEQSATRRAFVMDLSGNKPVWHEITSLPGQPRILPIAAAYRNAFYLFGGIALEPNATGKVERVYLRDSWRYDSVTGWKGLADLPKPLAAAPSPAPIIQGEALLLAGDDGSLVHFQPIAKHPGWSRTILAYDFARNRWREAGKSPAPRATAPCVEWNGRFVVPSGEVRPGVRSPEVWVLSH